MNDYKNLYYLLFNRITDIIEEMKTIQQLSEEMFITFQEDSILQEEKETVEQ